VWQAAFGRFGDARARSGVRAERIQRPIDDDRYIVIDLDFDTAREAEGFRDFLEKQVWSTPGDSPALVGAPHTRIFQIV
jgi:hypothetical protein